MCGTTTIETVAVKEPDLVTVVCFNCGVIVRAYYKDKPDEDIKIKED